MPDCEDKRNFIRVPEQFSVTCEIYTIPRTLQAEKAEGMSRNISAGGILFTSGKPFKPGEILRVSMQIPDWENRKVQFFKPTGGTEAEPFQALAEVIRCHALNAGYEIAVKFIAIDDGHQLALDKLARYESRKLTEEDR